MQQNRGTLVKGIAKVEKETKQYIADTRSPKNVAAQSDGGGFASLLMNNPITEILLKFNPLSWLMEAIGEELGDIVQIPSLPESLAKVSDQIGSLVQNAFSGITAIFQDLVNKLGDLMNDKSTASDIVLQFVQNTFWTIWDQIASLIVSVWDILTNAIEGMAELMAATTWKIPFITTLFTKIAKQEFSLLNALTFGGAAVLNIVFQASTGRLPFDVLPTAASLFKDWDTTSLDMSPMLGLNDQSSDLEKFRVPQGMVKGEKQMTPEEQVRVFILSYT
jgi:hypothetical protein